MTSRQPPTALGNTHASRVSADCGRSEGASGIVTRAAPLNERAFPYLPNVVQVAAPIAPVFPPPDASPTLDPAPSSNEYAATSPGDCPRPADGRLARAVMASSPSARPTPATRRSAEV